MTTDTDEIVVRLRAQCNCNIDETPCGAEEECRSLLDAADEIERLRAEAENIREALREYIYITTHLATPEKVDGKEYRRALIPYSAIQAARSFLGVQP